MKVRIARQSIIHDRLGRLVRGQVVEMPEKQAQEFIARGFVERYETKVIHSHPIQPAGEEEPPSALQAGQASPQTMPKPSGSGKRGRPKKGQ